MSQEKLNIDFKKGSFKGTLRMVEFNEGDSHIIYLPSLQLSSYGDTLTEARELLEIQMDELSKSILAMGELKGTNYLKSLGWAKQQFFKKRLVNLSETTYDDIKREFNLPEGTELHSSAIAV